MKVFNEYLNLEGISTIRELFLEKGEVHQCQKNNYFIRQGQYQKTAGFIKSGGFRYLCYSTTGKEQIVGYSFENDFVVNYGAFQTQTLSVTDAQAIRNSVVYVLTFEEIQDFFINQDTTNLRARVAETFLADIYSRMLSLYCDQPEERYLKLLERYPQIVNEVSLREIASFIKMTPETLSRIRRKIALF